jgi:hypothetical protein
MKWLWHTSRYYPGICLEALWKTTKNTPVRIVGDLAKIWTGHLPKYTCKALMLEPRSLVKRIDYPYHTDIPLYFWYCKIQS